MNALNLNAAAVAAFQAQLAGGKHDAVELILEVSAAELILEATAT